MDNDPNGDAERPAGQDVEDPSRETHQAEDIQKTVELQCEEEREVLREFAKKLVKTFDGTGMKITPAELEKDGVATVELDKLIVRALRKMVEKNIMSPLMKLGMAFMWDEEVSPGGPVEDRDWAVHTVGYRVVCSAMLLEKYRHLQRVKRTGNDPLAMNKPISADSLFDKKSGLVNGKTTLGDKMSLYKKILTARGIIPRRPSEPTEPKAG